MTEKKDSQYLCGRCGAPLETVKAAGNYLNYDFTTELLGCVNCGTLYVPEDLVNSKVAQVEALLEKK